MFKGKKNLQGLGRQLDVDIRLWMLFTFLNALQTLNLIIHKNTQNIHFGSG